MPAEADGKTDGAAYASRCLSQSSIHLSLLGGDIAVGEKGRQSWSRWSQQDRKLYLKGYATGAKNTVKGHVQNIARQAATNNTTAMDAAQRGDSRMVGAAMANPSAPGYVIAAGYSSVYRQSYGNTLRSYVR